MTAVAAAKSRLETWLAEVWLRHESLDLIKLRRLEDEIASAALVHEPRPF
jgi:hypothetical protein